jgi:manganese-dependent ADP-ribose/CDP-alcohol diphosphatase
MTSDIRLMICVRCCSFRLLNLDTYDVSVLGAEEGTAEHTLATAYLARNPNDDKRSPQNLRGTDRRFVAFNGGIGAAQLAWLRQELQESLRWVYIYTV